MGQGGLEPPTPRLSSVCSNQLSYWPTPEKTRQTKPKNHNPGKDARPVPVSNLHPSRRHTTKHQLQHDLRQGHRTPTSSVRGSLDQVRGPPSSNRPRIHGVHDVADQAFQPGADLSVFKDCRQPRHRSISPHQTSLKGGDPAAGSPTATLLRLHPSR